ncbi:MAG: type II secretion system protein [Gemmatimonadaceae bacterium]
MRLAHVSQSRVVPGARSGSIGKEPGTGAGGSGFTLLEILIALVILSVVSAITLPAFFQALRSNDEGTMRTDVQRLQFQARAYYDAHGQFPQTPSNGWTSTPVAGLDFRPSQGMQLKLERSGDGQSVTAYVGPVAPPARSCLRRMGGYDTGAGIECTP